MSLIVLHLRWDDVDPEQFEEFCRAVPDGVHRPVGCLSRFRRRQGRAVLATDVWIDGQHADAFLSSLTDVLGSAAMGQPQTAAFSVPAVFAVGYGAQPAAAPTTTADVSAVPAPRQPADSPVVSPA